MHADDHTPRLHDDRWGQYPPARTCRRHTAGHRVFWLRLRHALKEGMRPVRLAGFEVEPSGLVRLRFEGTEDVRGWNHDPLGVHRLLTTWREEHAAEPVRRRNLVFMVPVAGPGQRLHMVDRSDPAPTRTAFQLAPWVDNTDDAKRCRLPDS